MYSNFIDEINILPLTQTATFTENILSLQRGNFLIHQILHCNLYLPSANIRQKSQTYRYIHTTHCKVRFTLPELTGDRFPLPVNTARVSTSRVDGQRG